MAIYLLDTSVAIDAINGKRGRRKLLEQLVEAGEVLACSAMTVAEIYAGIRPQEIEKTEALLDGLDHFAVDRDLARYAGLLKNEWAKRGRALSLPDVTIAATALAYKLVLMTDNRKDFPMPGLALYALP